MNLNDWIGAIGVFLILLAYVLTVINVITNKSLAYILLNFFGAVLAGLASVLINYVPFIVLEAAWAFVALFSLYKFFKNRN